MAPKRAQKRKGRTTLSNQGTPRPPAKKRSLEEPPVGIGLRPPREQDKPIREPKVSLLAFEKFKDVHISVDTFKSKPHRVWYLPKDGAKPTMENQYIINYLLEHDAFPVENYFRTFQSKWQDKRKSKESEEINVMMSLFESFSEALHYVPEDSRWAWSEVGGEAHIEKLNSYNRPNELKFVIMFQSMQLHSAFVSGMSCNAACTAIRCLFQLAAMVAFGQNEGLEKAVVRQVSSSRVKEQSFPLHETLLGCLTNRDQGLVSAPLRDANDDDVSCAESDARSDTSCEDQSDMSFDDGSKCLQHPQLTFADVVVISGHEPNWPRFLILAKMKKQGFLSGRNQAQLVRKMLGPAMHQSFVFGLIMNDEKARFYLMYHDYGNKQIVVKQILSYHFENRFKETIQKMFVDIVALLDFAKHNIQEVCHGFK